MNEKTKITAALAVVVVILGIVVGCVLGGNLSPNITASNDYEGFKVTDTGRDIRQYILEQNGTIVKNNKAIFIPMFEGDYALGDNSFTPEHHQVFSEDRFLEKIKTENVTAIITDYLSPEYPDTPIVTNCHYVLSVYHYWYFTEIEGIGEVAIIAHCQVNGLKLD